MAVLVLTCKSVTIKTWDSLPRKASSRMRRCCFSEIPESLNVFNSEAASKGNFNGLSSLIWVVIDCQLAKVMH